MFLYGLYKNDPCVTKLSNKNIILFVNGFINNTEKEIIKNNDLKLKTNAALEKLYELFTTRLTQFLKTNTFEETDSDSNDESDVSTDESDEDIIIQNPKKSVKSVIKNKSTNKQVKSNIKNKIKLRTKT